LELIGRGGNAPAFFDPPAAFARLKAVWSPKACSILAHFSLNQNFIDNHEAQAYEISGIAAANI